MKKDKRNRKNEIKEAFAQPVRGFKGRLRGYFEITMLILAILGLVCLFCFFAAIPTLLTLQFQSYILTFIVIIVSIPWAIYLYSVFINLLELLE